MMIKNFSKVLGVIPARYESSRFPGKPLQKILGKTLIQRTYENALLSKKLDELIVATDDDRIFDHVKEFGGKVVLTSKNCLTGTDRVAEAVKNHHFECSLIVNIQGDEPCLNPAVIDRLIEEHQKVWHDPNFVMVTPVVQLQNTEDILNPSIVKCVFDLSGRALYFSRAPIPFPKAIGHLTAEDLAAFKKHRYYRHLGVYSFHKEFLLQYSQIPLTPLQASEDLEQLKILEHGYSIRVVIVHDEAIGVDRPEDIKKVEEILCSQNTFSLQVV